MNCTGGKHVRCGPSNHVWVPLYLVPHCACECMEWYRIASSENYGREWTLVIFYGCIGPRRISDKKLTELLGYDPFKETSGSKTTVSGMTHSPSPQSQWTIEPDFLDTIKSAAEKEYDWLEITMEDIEAILLTVERHYAAPAPAAGGKT